MPLITRYSVKRVPEAPPLSDPRNFIWSLAEVVGVENFRPESSNHHPYTRVRLLHDGFVIYGLFEVTDRYVRCVRTKYGDDVYKDSCVEFFLRPSPSRGYFNFEFNCGGAFLSSYIRDPARVPGGFKDFERLGASRIRSVRVFASLPGTVDPEMPEPIDWWLAFSIPIGIFEEFVGPIGELRGQEWHGNFYKCADESSHPHWASWAPVDELNFHLPRCFGAIAFE
jgi:hypothetical protein